MAIRIGLFILPSGKIVFIRRLYSLVILIQFGNTALGSQEG